ncbi:MAG: outer membrane beta-barrel protein [Bacteroidaceae bacterium]|nr:outer membrane beta-barrel protein [Bacteroidaceae bacterium]
MNKRVLSFVAVVATCMNLYAQWDSPEMNAYMRTAYKQIYEVSGKVYGSDEFEPKPYPLQGANVKVVCLGDTTKMDGQSVWKDGVFDVWLPLRERLKDTRVKVTITYVGMDTFEKIYSPEKTKENGVDKYNIKIDSVVLRSKPMTIAEAEVVAELKRMYQRGDTVIFNADAYEMPSGSVLLDLVRRLPGLKYESGKMTYMGKDIEEIKLNGDSFFKHDMSIALNNMPHEKLKSLSIYEELKDTLDVKSEKHLVMDMETKEPMSGTIFAELNASTTEKFNHYGFGGNISMWRQKGLQLNGSFNTQDIPDEGTYQLKSVRTFGNLMAEYNFNDKASVSANANHNYNRNETKNDSYTKEFLPDYTQNSMNESFNSNQSKNWSGGINSFARISEKLYFNANVNMDKSDTKGYSESNDTVSYEGEGLVRTTRQINSSNGDNKSVNGNFSLNYAFDEEHNNELSLNYGVNHSDGTNTSYNKSYSRFVQRDSISDVNHRILTPNRNNSHDIMLRYSRRIGGYGYMGMDDEDRVNSYLSIGYGINYATNTSTQNYEDILADGTYAQVDSLHYDKRNRNFEQRFELSYFYSDKKSRLNTSVQVSPRKMTIDNDQYGNNEHIENKGVRLSFNANYTLNVKKDKYTVRYTGSNVLPDVEQLSHVTNYSDPMNISVGNPNLKNAFNHNFQIEYQLKSLMRLQLAYGFTDNQITTLTLLDKSTGARRTSPANINGNWNTREYVYFTIPIHDFTLSLNATHSFNHGVSYVQNLTDNEPWKSATKHHNFSSTISGSYGNKYWMMRGGVGYSMNHSKSDYLTTATKGQAINANADISYEAPFGLELGIECDFNKPFGYEMAAANKTECLLNLRAEYHFLKRKLATIGVNWRDILNSYNGFNASMNGTTWNESRTYGDTSMFVISFSYRINAFD